MNQLQQFWSSPRPEREWFSAGLASSFPDLGLGAEEGDERHLAQPRPCKAGQNPGCKAFHVPSEGGGGTGTEVAVGQEALEDTVAGDDLKDQVLVFQHRGKFHAVDHVSGGSGRTWAGMSRV
ncbi:hypothetical protein IMZ48_29730 [Candidatus Bathyarchaeota archaeon]|nr:hypothetical protein [Candidatus Bathyarchaeota archaeon]